MCDCDVDVFDLLFVVVFVYLCDCFNCVEQFVYFGMNVVQFVVIGVYWQGIVWCNGIVYYEVFCFIFVVEFQVFEKQKCVQCECIIQLDDIDIIWGNVCYCVSVSR